MEASSLGKMANDFIDAMACGCHVTPTRHIVLRSSTPLSRSHREIATGAFDAKHRLRGVTVKLAMQPLNEVDGCGLRQVAFNRPAINFCLHANVSGSRSEDSGVLRPCRIHRRGHARCRADGYRGLQ